MASSSASSARATAAFSVRGCKLNRRGLEKLVRAMQEGAPTDATLTYSTARGVTTYEADSVQGLADAVAASTEPGDSDVLNNLVVVTHHYDGQPSVRTMNTIRVSINDGRASCGASGEPTWVKGKVATLQPLLDELRPFKWGFWYLPRYSYVIWCASLGSWASLIINNVLPSDSPADYLVLAACVAASAFIGFAVSGFIVRKARLEIWLTRDDFPEGYWRFSASEATTAAIAILGLIVAVIFGVTAHKDAQKDEGVGKSMPTVRSIFDNSR
ncbi:hypothetical protein ACFU53_24680 [Streptomyces sp. NPDC057474]|uniref:hypothetical protein n=1 Tax=Streptomyces sp. NPDC057474 TaxID=3346144 RepID=UPI00369F54A4